MANMLRELFARITVKTNPGDLQNLNNQIDGAKQKLGELSVMLAGIGISTALATSAFTDLAREGAQLKQVATAFKELGGTASDMEDLRKITGGLVADEDLMRASNLGKLFKLPAEQIPHLLKIAQGSSVALGTSVAKNIDDVYTAVARNSAMIADNLGTQVGPLQDINAEYAKRNKLQVANLTNEQKTAAFGEAFIAKSQRQLALSAKAADNVLAIGDAATKNLRAQTAVIANTIAVRLIKGVIPLINRVTTALESWWNAGRKSAEIVNNLGGKFNSLGITTAKFKTVIPPAEKAINRLIGAFKILGTVLALFAANKIYTFIQILAAMTWKWVSAMTAAIKALGAIRAIMLIVPIILATIALLAQDILVWSRGGKSAIGAFIDKFAEGPGILGKIARFIKENKTQIVAFAQAAADAGAWIVAKIIEVGRAVWDVAQEIGSAISQIVGDYMTASGGVGGIASKFWRTAKGVVSSIWAGLRSIGPAVMGILGTIAETVQAILESGFVAPFIDIIKAVIEAVRGIVVALKPVVMDIVNTVIQLFKTLKPPASRVWDAVVRLVQALIPTIQLIAGIALKAFGKIAGVVLWLAGIVLDFVEWILPYVSVVIVGIVELAAWLIEEAIAFITEIVSWITWAVKTAASWIAWIMDNIITPIINWFTGAAEWAGGIFKNIVGAIKSAWDTVMGWLQPIIDGIMEAVDAAKWLAGNNDVYQSEATKKSIAEAQALGGTGFGGMVSGYRKMAERDLLTAQTQGAGGNSTTVGTIQVQVQAPTTPMGPAALSAATKEGTEQGMLKAAARDMSTGGE